METPHSQRPAIYILPTSAYASLLDAIAHDAPAGSVIEAYTEAMQALAEQTVHASGRPNIRVDFRQLWPPAMRQSWWSIGTV